MKYLGLLVILACIPLVSALLSSGPSGRRQIAFLFGLVPFFTQWAHIIVAPVSWPYWPGYVKGTEISLIDGIALGVIFSLRGNRAAANYAVPFFLLAGFAILSAPGTPAPTAALFVAWQTLRVWLVFVAASRLASDQDGIRAMIGGMVLGLGCNALAALSQRLHGVYQAPGLFSHQNSLGLATHFVALPAAALYVADRRAKWALIGLAAAGAVAILGASRATVGLEAAGLALLIVLIVMVWPSSRSMALLGAGVLGMALLSPLAYKALAPRFASVEHSDYDERRAFTQAALAMLHDHPGGVGANHYVIVANVQGYSDRFKVAAVEGSRSANVHNAYLLTAAEMGWAALVPFIWLTLGTAIHGIVWSLRSRDKRLSVMLLGSCVAQIVMVVHNWVEWVAVTYVIQVVLCLNLGIIAGLIGQVRTARRRSTASDGAPDSPDAAAATMVHSA